MAVHVDPSTSYSLLKDLYSPLGIAVITLYLTYLLTRLQTYRSTQDEVRRKRLSYIDFFSLKLSSLIEAYDSLITDLDESKRFQYKHINNALSYVSELKKMSEDVVIFSDDKFRENLISTIEVASILSGDINGLEKFEDDGNNTHKMTEATVLGEYQTIKLELLKVDIGVDVKTYIAYPLNNGTIKKNKLEEIKNLFSTLNNKLVTSQNDLNSRVAFCKDKRTILSTRILDAKTKLTTLHEQLVTLKRETQKKKLLFI